VTISVVKGRWVKCSEVLQCSDGLSNKVSNFIRRHTDNMKLLVMCILLLSHFFMFIRFYFLSMYISLYCPVHYCNLSIFIVMSIYSYCMFMYLHRASWHSSATLTEVFQRFFLSCKANARVKPTKTGHGTQSSKMFVLFYVLFDLCRSVYCLCVNVYCTVCV
jgi:hypothetical protein